jgi:hypothetical protein
MGRIWVLDTETKGTGAEMVPLDKVQRKPAPTNEPFFVPPKPEPRPPKPAEPRAPRRFRVVDVVTREVLADGAGARETVELLGGVRSTVDVTVSVWEPATERWRVLTLAEQRVLWDRRPGVRAGLPRRGEHAAQLRARAHAELREDPVEVRPDGAV